MYFSSAMEVVQSGWIVKRKQDDSELWTGCDKVSVLIPFPRLTRGSDPMIIRIMKTYALSIKCSFSFVYFQCIL